MSHSTIDQPRAAGDGRFSVKLRTEPAVSLSGPDEPFTASAARSWVSARVRTGGSLAGSSLALVDLSGLDMPGVNLATSDLWAADFDGADMPGANLAGCDLRSASFRGTHMPGVNLRGADLTGARLDETTNLAGAQYDTATTWPADFTAPDPADVAGEDPDPV
jgi:hypothetical protein